LLSSTFQAFSCESGGLLLVVSPVNVELAIFSLKRSIHGPKGPFFHRFFALKREEK
jgi:hypothetical protein